MTRTHENTAGFSIVEAVIVVAVIGIVGIAGWLVYQHDQTKATNAAANTDRSTTQQKSTPTPPPADPYAGWKTYTSKLGGISIKYPSDWTAPSEPYDSTILNGTAKEEYMSWQSPAEEFDGQQRGVVMGLQASTGNPNCDAELPIYKVQNVTVDGHHLAIITTISSNEIVYMYLTDATGLVAGDTLPTCSAAAYVTSPLPQTKSLQIWIQFVSPCTPGSHCAFVNTPLTPQQYSAYPLVSQVEKSFESVTFN